MKIIIIGAGLGGLSSAVRFSQSGHEVYVLERREKLAPQGGGLNIRPGASRILETWGLAPQLDTISMDTPTVLLRSVATGDIIVKRVAVESSEYPDWGTTRQELMKVLYQAALDAGAQIQFGTTVTGVSDDKDQDHALVHLHDGRQMGADLILAADGIRSKIRTMVLSNLHISLEPDVSRNTLYGFEVPADDLRALPGTSRLMDQVSINTWMSQGGFVVSRYNPKTERVGIFFGINSETDQKDLWDENGDIQFVREFFKGACTELAAALRLTTTCDRWKLAELPDLPRWTSQGGRIVLLGDSAHAMHPSAAQGYSQIVEDIGVLDFLLKQETAVSEVSEVTKIWQAIRKPRVERIKEFARWNTRAFTGELTGLDKATQANSIKSLKRVTPDREAEFHTSAFLKWALDYDAIGEARAYLNRVKSKL